MSMALDQKAYLQKYLGGPSGDKKRKRKKNVKGKGFKIIDDDLDLSKLRPLDGDELDILNEGEDAPQIAGIIDDRPEELKFRSSSKWRVINQDDGFNSKLKVEEVNRTLKEVEEENEIVFGKMYSDSEDENKNDSDTSLPRKSDSTNKEKSKKRNKQCKQHSDSDVSPPRRDKSNAKKNYDSDVSPPRKNSKKTNKTDNDASPSRQNHAAENTKSKHHRYDPEVSATRKTSRDNTSKRKRSKTYQNDSDASPARRNSVERNNSQKNNSHTSPKIESNRQRIRKPSRWGDFKDNNMSKQRSVSPRTSDRTVKRRSSPARSSDQSYKNLNNTKQINYDSDISPRKSRRDSTKRDRSDPNISPSRKRSPDKFHEKRYKNDKYKDISPKRYKHKKYPEESSNNKKRHGSDSDQSPLRQERKKNYDNKRNTERKRHDSDSDLSPPRKERSMYQERRSRNSDEPPPTNKKMEKTLEGKKAGLQDAGQLKQENEAFRRREDEVFKNMTDEMSGRNAQIVSRKSKRETSEDRQKQKDKAERQKALDEKYKNWSKGLKQIESQQAAAEDFIHEASKPLARYKDDKDLETKLRDVERQGDPMLQYMREKKRERGELGPEKPTYKGNFAPNRFNIRPGYRWDGVDRSNGYEKKFFEQRSKRKAQEEELYKWNTEDL